MDEENLIEQQSAGAEVSEVEHITADHADILGQADVRSELRQLSHRSDEATFANLSCDELSIIHHDHDFYRQACSTDYSTNLLEPAIDSVNMNTEPIFNHNDHLEGANESILTTDDMQVQVIPRETCHRQQARKSMQKINGTDAPVHIEPCPSVVNSLRRTVTRGRQSKQPSHLLDEFQFSASDRMRFLKPLRHGWVREVVMRRDQAYPKEIKYDVTYIAPDQQRFASLTVLDRYFLGFRGEVVREVTEYCAKSSHDEKNTVNNPSSSDVDCSSSCVTERLNIAKSPTAKRLRPRRPARQINYAVPAQGSYSDQVVNEKRSKHSRQDSCDTDMCVDSNLSSSSCDSEPSRLIPGQQTEKLGLRVLKDEHERRAKECRKSSGELSLCGDYCSDLERKSPLAAICSICLCMFHVRCAPTKMVWQNGERLCKACAGAEKLEQAQKLEDVMNASAKHDSRPALIVHSVGSKKVVCTTATGGNRIVICPMSLSKKETNLTRPTSVTLNDRPIIPAAITVSSPFSSISGVQRTLVQGSSTILDFANPNAQIGQTVFVNSSSRPVTVTQKPITSFAPVQLRPVLNGALHEMSVPSMHGSLAPLTCYEQYLRIQNRLRSSMTFGLHAAQSGFDAMLSIFRWLNASDLRRCQRVCKAWYQAASTPAVWKYAHLKDCKITDWSATARYLEGCRTTHLDLTGVKSGLTTFAQALSDLRFLQGLRFGQIVANVLDLIGGKLARLKYLRASFIELDAVAGSANNSCIVLNLQHLVQMRDLRALYFTASKGFCISQHNLNVLSSMNLLQKLSLLDIKADRPQSFEFLGQLVNLTVLEIGSCSAWNAMTYAGIGNLAQLVQLRLEDGGDTSAMGNHLCDALRKLTRLKRLHLVKFLIPKCFGVALTDTDSLLELGVWPNLCSEQDSTFQSWENTLESVSHLKQLRMLVFGILGFAIVVDKSSDEHDYPFAMEQQAAKGRVHTVYVNKVMQFLTAKLLGTKINVHYVSSDDCSAARI